MRVEFMDDDLCRCAKEPDFRPKGWGPDLIKAYRRKYQAIRAATDERDLRSQRSLRLEQLSGDRAGTSSIRLNGQFRLILRFESDDGRVAVLIEVVDYH